MRVREPYENKKEGVAGDLSIVGYGQIPATPPVIPTGMACLIFVVNKIMNVIT